MGNTNTRGVVLTDKSVSKDYVTDIAVTDYIPVDPSKIKTATDPNNEFMGVWKFIVTPELANAAEKTGRWKHVDMKVSVHFFEVWFYGPEVRMFEISVDPKKVDETPEWHGYDSMGVCYDDTAIMIEPSSRKCLPSPADSQKTAKVIVVSEDKKH